MGEKDYDNMCLGERLLLVVAICVWGRNMKGSVMIVCVWGRILLLL